MGGEKSSKKFCVGMRILLVDDSIVCARVIEKLLQGGDNKVVAVRSATNALNLLEDSKGGFDVVLTDVYMPIMNGFELLKIVGREFKIPVVMMSGDERMSTMKKGLRAGACFYISKPLDFSKVQNLWQFVVRDRPESRILIDPRRNAKYLSCSLLEHGENLSRNSKRKMVPERKDSKAECQTIKKKERLIWTRDLHYKFLDAIRKLGHEKPAPRKILELMNVKGLSRQHIASHLQKYRNHLKLRGNSSQLVGEPRNPVGLVKRIHEVGITPYSYPQFYPCKPRFQDSLQWCNADAGQSSINQGNVQHSGLENFLLINRQSAGSYSMFGSSALPLVNNSIHGRTMMPTPLHSIPQTRAVCLPSTSYQQDSKGMNLQVQDSLASYGETGTELGSYDMMNQFPNFSSGELSINNHDQTLRDEIRKGKTPMEEVETSDPLLKFDEFNTTFATPGEPSLGVLPNPNQVQVLPQASDLQEQQNDKDTEYVPFLDFVRQHYPIDFSNIFNEEDQSIYQQQGGEDSGDSEFNISQFLIDGSSP